jgi:hypothetical protein
VAKAAAHAVTHPGTEVAGAQLHGKDSGRRGRFARLLRRTEATESEPADEPASQEPKMIAGRTP